jgi:hypothetical protein
VHVACFPWEEFKRALLGFFIERTDITELDLLVSLKVVEGTERVRGGAESGV